MHPTPHTLTMHNIFHCVLPWILSLTIHHNIVFAFAFLQPVAVIISPHSSLSLSHAKVLPTNIYSSSEPRASHLYAEYKLWDRLEIEEDTEPYWYLLNCVATLELDLMRQCRAVTSNMDDAIQFIVPLERHTRSHGAKKMISEDKVKYPGYVFAKLRLTPPVYEAIQKLDLCRSWMGNVNRKGYMKRPVVPIALNELEVQQFGLEDFGTIAEEENRDILEKKQDRDTSETNVIVVDSDEAYSLDEEDEYSDPMYRGIDRNELKQYMGLKVEEMIKVTKLGKFYNEDGIVRRLKDGNILVRFYTYGTLFEEWLSPECVRKLSAEEVERGLGGPVQPITQRDLDSATSNNIRELGIDGRSLRSSLTDTTHSGRPRSSSLGSFQRNRRQDRTARRSNGVAESVEEQLRQDRNWNWYKDMRQERLKTKRPDNIVSDEERSMRPGSLPNNEDINANKNTNSQRKGSSAPLMKNVERRFEQKPHHPKKAPSDNSEDWSMFVTELADSRSESIERSSSKRVGQTNADEFFAALMEDLHKDVSSAKDGSRGANILEPIQSSPSEKHQKQSDEDFFVSLIGDIRDQTHVSLPDPSSRDIASIASDLGHDDVLEADFARKKTELLVVLPDPSTETFLPQSEGEVADTKSMTSKCTTDNFKYAEEKQRANNIKSQPKLERNTTQHALSSPVSPLDTYNLEKLAVPALKDLLRKKGLKVGGKKSELLERLLSSLSA